MPLNNIAAPSERELALIDKVIGLEAENANLKILAELNDIRILHDSRAWKLGMVLLRPLAAIKRIIKK